MVSLQTVRSSFNSAFPACCHPPSGSASQPRRGFERRSSGWCLNNNRNCTTVVCAVRLAVPKLTRWTRAYESCFAAGPRLSSQPNGFQKKGSADARLIFCKQCWGCYTPRRTLQICNEIGLNGLDFLLFK